ncbi:hypothetical protein BDZ89DRAFT_473659 [Hymenopellis radicata]|nr:hypothetical protein BDZ89DRAFT_473659 [Hymenopellis radicata]
MCIFDITEVLRRRPNENSYCRPVLLRLNFVERFIPPSPILGGGYEKLDDVHLLQSVSSLPERKLVPYVESSSQLTRPSTDLFSRTTKFAPSNIVECFIPPSPIPGGL